MGYFKTQMSSSDLPNSKAIIWSEVERDGSTWMGEGIIAEQAVSVFAA